MYSKRQQLGNPWAIWLLLASLSLVIPASAKEAQFELYNVILMLDDGPVHARFGIAMHSRPVAEQRVEFIKNLFAELDTDGDQKLTRDEANQSYVLRRNISKGTRTFIQKRNLTAKRQVSMSELRTRVKQVAGQPVVFRENDEAFASDEYIFGLIDEDASGTIDAKEMSSAATRLFQRDQDDDQCIGFDELQPPPEPQDPNILQPQATTPREEVTHSVFSDLLRLTTDRFLPQRMMRKYDLNGNGKLSAKELRWDAKRLEPADTNGDGQLSRSELKRVEVTPLDIDLTVDVAPREATHPEFNIKQTTGKRLDRTSRPGIANLMLQNATVTISYRHVDPISAAIDNALRKFNLLDADTNGYLEKTELEGEPLFRRGLFDQMDTDRDQKVFSQELETYVRERAEVKAMSCRVNIFDTGSGFFQVMDHNNDGRISQREMRSAELSLKSLAVDANPGVSKAEPARRYHIEFSRGSYLLFGPGQQRSKQSISFNTQVSVGPTWFVGSDRNNDGDLTWNEFLGHREDFHFLDLDQDGLIDPIEAQRAEELKPK